MKYNLVLAGVGGQGVLSVASIIALAALEDGYKAQMSEIHGMAQRGGAVTAHLRLSNSSIATAQIPEGEADMILSAEPLESLRYLPFLKPDGKIVTASDPYRNIPDYPDLDALLKKIQEIPGSILVEAEKLAKKAGSSRAHNVVVLGAASHHLPIKVETFHNAIQQIFSKKGDKIINLNIEAFNAGRQAAQS